MLIERMHGMGNRKSELKRNCAKGFEKFRRGDYKSLSCREKSAFEHKFSQRHAILQLASVKLSTN